MIASPPGPDPPRFIALLIVLLVRRRRPMPPMGEPATPERPSVVEPPAEGESPVVAETRAVTGESPMAPAPVAEQPPAPAADSPAEGDFGRPA